ncbi:MAG: 3-methylitaconate isomerase [Alphaproteobacteria bacterium]|nr:3-methylitaconate isomerase [Alphaproteobacteria bacterium]MCB9929950.1 3-methylitaconate isomerase [Alphaproteobacteria bacterium]
MSHPIRAWIIRGGTSKGIYLKESDLPRDPARRDRTILGIFGSPDKRQIDGLGGADPLTSKCCIIGPPPKDKPHAAGCDLTYTFGQVELDQPHVDYHSLCGNLTAGVAAFALWENMVAPTDPVTHVRIYNRNLDAVLLAEVPTKNGRPLETGGFVMPGVPGTGAKIVLDLAATGGSSAGRSIGGLLPTGNAVDTLDVPGFGPIQASLVDCGNAHVFVRAADVGIRGTETAAEIDANTDLRDLLERIRSQAAHRMGMVDDPANATRETPATPILGMIAPPQDYWNVLQNRQVHAEECDFLTRLMFMQQMHKTYAGTSTVCTGVASKLPGTIVHEAARPECQDRLATHFGHPAGVIETEARVELRGNTWHATRATVARTARRIMEGQVYVPAWAEHLDLAAE